ncbi:MAG TPA: helix-turn-helix transcriptional regulator [Polyangia bacterium]|nr:helix-turn-helix transcriptional regulator [Polyangia bacterium]
MESLMPLPKIKRKPQTSFCQRLVRFRRVRGLTRWQLAAVTGISQRMIAYYETRVVSPSADVITKLIGVLQSSADDSRGVEPRAAASSELPLTTIEIRPWRTSRKLRHFRENEHRAVLKIVNSFLAGHRAAND